MYQLDELEGLDLDLCLDLSDTEIIAILTEHNVAWRYSDTGQLLAGWDASQQLPDGRRIHLRTWQTTRGIWREELFRLLGY